jgi:glycosyltransferase involved in cell wall biosynthesis
MRVVIFSSYMPDPCGAFFHDIVFAKELQRRGHTVNFVITSNKVQAKQGVYRGLQWKHFSISEREMNGANIWCSPHFPFLKVVRRLNERFQKPLLITMHFGENRESITEYPRLGKWAEMLWIISDHIKNHIMETTKLSSAIKVCESVRPLMLENEIKFQERGILPPGDCITLVNANILKGLPLFIELANRFPNRKFLGVRPYYNKINVPENIKNIEWIDVQDDIRVVLQKTRIMIVPSQYESWGRVAFEAMYNGIPVVHSLPYSRSDSRARISGSSEGMQEWIQGTQLGCSYDNIDQWVKSINSLDDPEVYAEYSQKAYDRTYEMNIFADFEKLEKKLVDYANTYPPPVEVSSGSQPLVTHPNLQIRASSGNAMPFRGGRFSVRR